MTSQEAGTIKRRVSKGVRAIDRFVLIIGYASRLSTDILNNGPSSTIVTHSSSASRATFVISRSHATSAVAAMIVLWPQASSSEIRLFHAVRGTTIIMK